jgi:histidine phosphotransferase ChpT
MADNREVVLVASLLASRLCHDLVNPVGALNTGLEVLDEEGDAEMREHAMSLIRESTRKTVTLLTFARVAFGATGSWDGTIDAGEAGELSRGLYAHSKAALDWRVPPGPMPKPLARILLNLTLVAERCVPRADSVVTADADRHSVTVTATGKRAKLGEDLVAALSGDLSTLEAKGSPAYLAFLIAEAAGGTIRASQEGEEKVVFSAELPD